MTKKEKFIAWLKRTPRASHIIRVLAGFYLVYTAYQIFKELGKGQNDILIIVCAVAFVIIGAFIGLTSMYAMSKYYYAENTAGDDWDKETEEKAAAEEENNTET